MKYVVTPEQIESLKKNIQNFVDFAMNIVRENSKNWDMSDMEELIEVGCVNKIEVVDIEYESVLIAYVDIYQTVYQNDFDFLIYELQDILKDIFPGIVLMINNVIGP
jgi:hypothetical protein